VFGKLSGTRVTPSELIGIPWLCVGHVYIVEKIFYSTRNIELKSPNIYLCLSEGKKDLQMKQKVDRRMSYN
jgi:hypothetical protein